MMLLPLTLVFTLFASNVIAGTGQFGSSCSQKNLRLQLGTYQLYTECDSQTYCHSNGTCAHRGCRRDTFPFGYPQGSTHIPDKCEENQFCPDEEDACLDKIAVGSPCQLNRDDQCQAPPNFAELRDDTGRGLNVNGSVCLKNVCMWANATLGSTCVVENTGYTAYGMQGEYIDIVSRGNCRVGLYCDSVQLVCMQNKNLGDTCSADKECDSWNCLESGVCGKSTSTPAHYGIYVYILVALGIFAAVFGTMIILFIVHRRQRDVEREKRAQYWQEQNAFHQALRQMRETARASIMSFGNNGQNSARSTLYGASGSDEDAQSPMFRQGGVPKGSGLRHDTSDDVGFDSYDEGVIMHSKGNKF